MLKRTFKMADGTVFNRVTRTTFIKKVKENGEKLRYAFCMNKMGIILPINVMREVECRQNLYPEYTYGEQVRLAVEVIENEMYYYNANKDNGYTLQYYVGE